VAAVWKHLLAATDLPCPPVTWAETPAEGAARVLRSRADSAAMWGTIWNRRAAPTCGVAAPDRWAGREVEEVIRGVLDPSRWSFGRYLAFSVRGGWLEIVFFNCEGAAVEPAALIRAYTSWGEDFAPAKVWRTLLRRMCVAWICPDEIVCVPSPRVSVDATGNVHSAVGPAISWGPGSEYFFWHGARLTHSQFMAKVREVET